MSNIKISVIIPVYNESKHIEENILGILSCDFPKENMEIIYVDGMSSDNTCEIINKYAQKFPMIRCLKNEKKFTPFAANIGIKNARGKYVLIAGAHSKFDTDYIRVLVEQIEKLHADGVGGMLRTEVANKTKTSLAIKKVLGNRFGVGNASYRTSGAAEVVEVDTAGFLCYNKERIIEIGGYNEKLIRNQDIELNKRIKKNGGRIYLVPNTYVTYYARESYRELTKNNFENGKWNILTIYYTKDLKSLSLRHFIPLIFILSLMIPGALYFIWKPFLWVTVGSIMAYNLLIISQSIKMNDKDTSVWSLIKAFYTLHFSYGIGSISGILKILKIKVLGE